MEETKKKDEENITSEIKSFYAFTKDDEKIELKIYLNHNNLNIHCLIKEEINIKEYQKILTLEEIKKENKLFSICENINEIKDLLIDYIKNANSTSEKNITAKIEQKKIIIKIPTFINLVKEIYFILNEKERNVNEIIDNLEKNLNRLFIEKQSEKKELEQKITENKAKINFLENKLKKCVACPDYKKAFKINSGYAIKENGYILFNGTEMGERKYGYINNLFVFTYGHVGNMYNGSNICIYPVSIGDVITFTNGIITSFIPEIK